MTNFYRTLTILEAKYLYLVIIGVAVLFILFQPKKVKKDFLLYAIVTVPIVFIFLKLASTFYYDPRPFVTGNFTPLIPHAPDNGFPSDHTILSATIASLLYPFDKKLSVLLWLLTLLVSMSRVLTGVHHWIDVAASMGMAIIASVFSYTFIFSKLKNSSMHSRLANIKEPPR
jgi:undecaprenyl-diphosphatase